MAFSVIYSESQGVPLDHCRAARPYGSTVAGSVLRRATLRSVRIAARQKDAFGNPDCLLQLRLQQAPLCRP